MRKSKNVKGLVASTMNILVIDDNPAICDSCRKFLERDGYKVDTLTDPTKAVEHFRQNHFQIVILDLIFPANSRGITGKKLLDDLLQADSDVCVIILTAHATEEDIIATLGNYKAFDLLRKPLSGEKLREVIRKAILQHGFPVNRAQEVVREVGKRIRLTRKQKNMTMAQLSLKIQLSTSLISQIERGESSPSIPTLYKISWALNLSLDKLFEGF